MGMSPLNKEYVGKWNANILRFNVSGGFISNPKFSDRYAANRGGRTFLKVEEQFRYRGTFSPRKGYF